MSSSDTLLDEIQRRQFHDRAGAEALLLTFVRETFPQLAVERLELRPLAVSLNSFNGFLYLADGATLFFKTHTEPDGVVGEYYQASQLAEAGYPILQPLYQSHSAGKQLLIYPLVEAPSVFDVAWAIEQGDLAQTESLTAAQQALDDQLFKLYEQTLAWQTADAAAQAPIHQLFFHRLAGGRCERFYGGSDSEVVISGQVVNFRIVKTKTIKIKKQTYEKSLQNIIEKSVKLLSPAQASASIIGHGDAHNGNVFFHRSAEQVHLSYFDPAFAGRHDPLLDLTKPLFHNVFAMWMYYPNEKAAQTQVEAYFDGDSLVIDHDYVLHPIREMFLQSKVERVLIPTLRLLKMRGWLRPNWREYLKAALFCCPFLTKNLIDAATFPPKISLLGLAMAVEMGAESQGERSKLDRLLDGIERLID